MALATHQRLGPAAAAHAVTTARICFKEKRGAERGKTVPPAEALAMLRFAVPEGFSKTPGAEVGALLARTATLLQQPQ